MKRLLRRLYPAPIHIHLFTLSWLDKDRRIATGAVGFGYGRDRLSKTVGPRTEIYQWIASPTCAQIFGQPHGPALLDDERWLLMRRLTDSHDFKLIKEVPLANAAEETRRVLERAGLVKGEDLL